MGHNFQEPTLVNPQIAAIPRYSYDKFILQIWHL